MQFLISWCYTIQHLCYNGPHLMLLLLVLCVHFRLMTNWIFERGVAEQTKAFLEGFNEVVPLQWLQYFDERELEVEVEIFCLF